MVIGVRSMAWIGIDVGRREDIGAVMRRDGGWNEGGGVAAIASFNPTWKSHPEAAAIMICHDVF